MWGFTELPSDREEARKNVEKMIKDVDKDLVNAIWRKFEQQYDMADLIRESEKLKEEDDDTFDSDAD